MSRRRLTNDERAVREIISRYRQTRLRKFENFWGVTINEDADGTSAVSPFLSNPERTFEENLTALESWLNTYGAHKTKVGGRGKGRKPPKTRRTLCISAEDDAKLKALMTRTGKGASHLFSAMVRYCYEQAERNKP